MAKGVRGKACLRDDPTTAARGKSSGVRGLMIVGRMRIRDQYCWPADRCEFSHAGGPSTTDRQMRSGQPRRNIVEKGTHVCGYPRSAVYLLYGGEILRTYLLANPQHSAQSLR